MRRWIEANGYKRYVGSSVKREAAIDWSDRRARWKLLGEIVAGDGRLLKLARQAQERLAVDSREQQATVDAAELLGQLLLQDVQRRGTGDDAGDVDVAVLKVFELFLVPGGDGQRGHRAVGEDGAGTTSRPGVKALAA